jgi:hypothetical protein
VGAAEGADVGDGVGAGVGDGVGEGVGVAWTVLLTVIVVVAHGAREPAGRLCHTTFWPAGPMVVTVVVKPAAEVQTSCAWPSLVAMAKFGTVQIAGGGVGRGVAFGPTFTGSPDPAKLVITTAVADVVRGIELPTMLPMITVARRKVARTDTR